MASGVGLGGVRCVVCVVQTRAVDQMYKCVRERLIKERRRVSRRCGVFVHRE